MEMIIGKFLGTILILTVHNPNVHHNPKIPTDVTGFPDKNTLKATQLTQLPAFRHRNLSAAEWLTVITWMTTFYFYLSHVILK